MQFMMGPRPRCYMPSFMQIGPAVPEKKILKGFYHIWAWRPSWSCDLDPICKLSFPHPMEAPHEIWLQSAQWFQRRRHLKTRTHDTQTDRQQPCHISSPMSLRLRWTNNTGTSKKTIPILCPNCHQLSAVVTHNGYRYILCLWLAERKKWDT